MRTHLLTLSRQWHTTTAKAGGENSKRFSSSSNLVDVLHRYTLNNNAAPKLNFNMLYNRD
jgi:hypothetical protein